MIYEASTGGGVGLTRGRSIPGRLNLGLSAAQMAAALLIFEGLSQATAVWQMGLLMVGFVLVGNAIYFMLHEAEHRVLHPNPRLNDAVGTGLALFFPAPFALLRQVHLAHHHANRTPDEAFDLYLPEDPRWWKTLQFYGLLTGLFYVVTVLGGAVISLTPRRVLSRLARPDRQTSAVIRLLNPKVLFWVRVQTLGCLLFHVAVVWGLGVPLSWYVATYLVFGASWSTMQYLHHYGTPIDRKEGAIDLKMLPGLSWVWLHHNLHLTHHRYPRASWTTLPALARRDGSKPTSLWRQYLHQWRGPRLYPDLPATSSSRSASLESAS
ncbi:MAG: fatty acid desaturase [Planctomycetota bacterium]